MHLSADAAPGRKAWPGPSCSRLTRRDHETLITAAAHYGQRGCLPSMVCGVNGLVHEAPAADGSMFMLDARTEGVLAFGPDGALRRRIGRGGEGPGELLSPWRLGMLGRGYAAPR